MKISESWLREWANPPLDTKSLAEQLTMAGLEVDSIEPAAASLDGVVVASIVSVEPHPDADKLRVCQVNTGSDQLQIVCGAPNARPGLIVACATVGSVLPGDMKIKRAKLRGVESCGMLCGPDELGFDIETDGLWELPADAPIGASLNDWLQLEDQVIEVDLTPNRADCLSVMGVAREVALLNNLPMTNMGTASIAVTSHAAIEVQVLAPAACPRYMARVIKNVDVGAASPLWMQERLRRAGMRSIDAVVDITNYVMLELGQPLHAFDLAQIQGGICVRQAAAQEQIKLLDGREVQLDDEVLLIADAEKPLAMAGIMGGEHSGIGPDTKDILLESAFFAPAAITGRARRFGLHTESSHRYERGVDPQLAPLAMARATELFLAIVGGEAGPAVEVLSAENLPVQPVINLRAAKIASLLGLHIDADHIEAILRGTGCEFSSTASGWTVRPPSWRVDIQIEADLIEEVARVYGYNHLPETPMLVSAKLAVAPESELSRRSLADHLVCRGFREAVTYSFIDASWAATVALPDNQVAVKNPISADLAVMRPSMLPGLVAAAKRNLDRQESSVRLFESGSIFSCGEGYPQREIIALVMAGRAAPESWQASNQPIDFYNIRAELEALFAAQAKGFHLVPDAQLPLLHPGQSARIQIEGKNIGVIGCLHPALADTWGIGVALGMLEIDQQALLDLAVPAFAGLSRFPSVRRDIAILVDKVVTAEQLVGVIRHTASAVLTDVRIFDIYTGQGIDSAKKSVAIGLTFRDSSRTLKEEEIGIEVAAIIAALGSQLNASQR